MNRVKYLFVATFVLSLPLACARAVQPPPPPVPPETELEILTGKLETALPEGWHVIETGIASVPIGWTGDEAGLYAMVEDTQTRFLHPNGFHYYSFYRVWLMPPDWEGEMRQTPYISDSSPAYLLGVGEDHVAFYHSAGGNVWEEGPAALCTTLGLDRICYTDVSRRIVDLHIEEELTKKLQELEPAARALSPRRIVGLKGEGQNLYLEYVFASEDGRSEDELLAGLTRVLARNVFSSLPEIESLYLRRCTADTYTDTIVHRD